MIYAATGEEGIGNGYLPRDASGHQQAGYLRVEPCTFVAARESGGMRQLSRLTGVTYGVINRLRGRM